MEIEKNTFSNKFSGEGQLCMQLDALSSRHSNVIASKFGMKSSFDNFIETSKNATGVKMHVYACISKGTVAWEFPQNRDVIRRMFL